MNTKKLTIVGVLLALTVVGSFLTVPSPAGTVAFDSLPGYVAAGLFGPVIGGIVGSLGHLINAGMKSFALTIPAHLIIAAFMFMAMAAYGALYPKTKIGAVVAATLINGPLSLVPFIFIVSKEFAVMMLLPLTFASLVNILLATLVIPRLKKLLNE